MGDRQIRVGDLVMVVRPNPCCGESEGTGLADKVDALGSSTEWHCKRCRKAVPDVTKLSRGVIATSRLKRLDPDALNESIPTRQEIEA